MQSIKPGVRALWAQTSWLGWRTDERGHHSRQDVHERGQDAFSNSLHAPQLNQYSADSAVVFSLAAIAPSTTYTLTPSASSMYEGGEITFTITRSGDKPAETVYFSAWKDSASYPGDYEMENGASPVDIAVVFREGDSSEKVTMSILQDGVADGGQRFRAVVQKDPPASDPAINVAATGYITITEPSTSYSLTPVSETVTEGDRTITFTVTRSGDQPEETIYASTLFDTAKSADSDYFGLKDEPVRFSFGEDSETFTVTIRDDEVVEGTEHLRVMIGRVGASSTQALDISHVYIEDDDASSPPVTDTVREGTDTTATLSIGGSVEGRIEGEPISGDGNTSDQQGGFVDKDWFKVTLEKGRVYTFEAHAGSISTGQVAISLYKSNDVVAKAVVEGSNPSFTFDTASQAAATQVYYLAVSAGGAAPAWRTATGDYSLAATVSDAPPPPPPPSGSDDYRDEADDTGAPLGALNKDATSATGTIGPADSDDLRGDKDVFKLTFTQGQTYVLTMAGAGTDALSQSIFTVRSGTNFSTILATSSEGPAATMEFYAETGGTYYLRAGAGGANYATDQGGYRIELLPADGTVTPLDPGSTFDSALAVPLATGSFSYSGAVGGGDPSDLFAVSGPPGGGELLVRLSALSADIDLRMVNAEEGTIAGPSRNGGQEDELLVTVLEGGQTAYIKVYPGGLAPGSYTLHVSFTPTTRDDTSNLPSSTQLVGDHLLRTLAEFALGAYESAEATASRLHLINEGWKFYDYENINETPLAGLSWSGIFYNNSVAQALVARASDALVVSFRGTSGVGDVPHWLEMDEHFALFAPLVEAINNLITNDSSITRVYLTGHSLGAAIVDPFMATHPNFKRVDGSPVTFSAITFAHPDYQTDGTEALFNGLLAGFRKGLPAGLGQTYVGLREGIPNFGADERVTSFHNYLDPARLADARSDGLIPGVNNLIHFTADAGSDHSAQLYVYASDFLARSGVGDRLIRTELSGSTNHYLVPAPGVGDDNRLVSDVGNRIMVGGSGSDIYEVVANGIYSGNIVLDSSGPDDTLRLLSGTGSFSGIVRLGIDGTDLLVYPVRTGLAYSSELPVIRIYNHFSVSGRVEKIQWGGKSPIPLPSTADALWGWNNLYYRVVSFSDVTYSGSEGGPLIGSIDATGGPGGFDTVSFEPLKGQLSADLGALYAELQIGLTPNFQLNGVEAVTAQETISIDIAGMENIVGTSGADVLTGSDGPNSLQGGGGADNLFGEGGSDVLDGGGEGDSLLGGAGDDFLHLVGSATAVASSKTLVLQPGPEGQDKWITDVYYDGGLDDDTLRIGGWGDHYNSLIRFDLSAAGTPAQVGSALLRIYAVSYNSGTSTDILIDVLQTAWTESYVWSDGPPPYTNLTTVPAPALGWVEIDVTQAVNGWLANPASNFGLQLRPASNNNNFIFFVSSDATSDLTGNRPQLVLTWEGVAASDADTGAGGPGDDVYIVDGADVVTELVGEGTDEVRTEASAYSLAGLQVELLTGLGNVGQTLVGNALANVIDGGAGADTMKGGLGHDSYVVDDVEDVVVENAGGGTDTVRASVTYRLPAHVEKLILTGNLAIDAIGNRGANSLFGNVGANLLDGGAGADLMSGDAGSDVYVLDNVGDRIFENAGGGTDTVRSSISFSLPDQFEKLMLTGVSAINGIGNAFANDLAGNAAANRLDGAAGGDTMRGGSGNDVYVVDNAGDKVIELSGGGTDLVEASIAFMLPGSVERLTLAGSATHGTGNGGANLIIGNGLANVLDGGLGADQLRGGGGDDSYIADNARDLVVEASRSGTDTVYASANFGLAEGQHVEVLTTTDRLGTAAVNLTGNDFANRLYGNAGANVLAGKGGNDVLDGGAAADRMIGGAGNDSYVLSSRADEIVEATAGASGGFDTVFSPFGYSLGANLENLTLIGTAGSSGTGNELVNQLTGNGGANRLNGAAGADVMTGGLGNDAYVVDNVGDRVVETAGGGSDTVGSSISFSLPSNVEKLVLTGALDREGLGNSGANSITGNGGGNRLNGVEGNDSIDGGGGNDLIYGGTGNDTLRGGSGLDRFLFNSAPGTANADRILDFSAADDTINLLRGAFTRAGASGSLAPGAFYRGTAAHDSNDRIVYDAATGKIFYDADGSGAGAALLFATVTPGTALSHADFVIYG